VYFSSVNGNGCEIRKIYYYTPSINETIAVRKCHFVSELQLISSITRKW